MRKFYFDRTFSHLDTWYSSPEIIDVDAAGTYSVTVNNENGCLASDGILISYNALGSPALKINNGLTLYPNPAKEYITVDYSDPKLLFSQLIISGISGRQLLSTILKSSVQEIPLNGLAKGIYIMKMRDGRAWMVRKD